LDPEKANDLGFAVADTERRDRVRRDVLATDVTSSQRAALKVAVQVLYSLGEADLAGAIAERLGLSGKQ
jgi:hypothetical protein